MQPCIDDIKALYYTFLAVVKGASAENVVEEAALHLMTTSVNSTLEMVLSRDLMLTNLAITLSRAGTANPLRGLRYMLNCVLQVVESPMAAEVRADGLVFTVFPRLTGHLCPLHFRPV
jgi:hypothetical protein